MEIHQLPGVHGCALSKKSKRQKILLVLSVLMTLVTIGFAQSKQMESPNRGNAMQQSDEATGNALRKAIDERYEELDRANAIKPSGRGKNSIDDVVLRFIPVGMSFDQAEGILIAAGFKLGKRGNQPPIQNYFALRGIIDQYASTPFGKTSIVVDIQPRDPTDWSVVHAVNAVILRQFI